MNWTEAVVQKFERLRERLAAVEAERDCWKAATKRLEDAVLKAGCAVDSFVFHEDCIVTPNVRELRAERDAAQAGEARAVEALRTIRGEDLARLAAVEAERDAAWTEAARAVEALRKIRGADIHPDADGLIEDATCCYCCGNSADGCYEDCPRAIAAHVIDSAQDALDWLAQQRREAAPPRFGRGAGGA